MAIMLALPKATDLPEQEIGATFVVPAPRGCNLNCPFCFVRMRREARPGEQALGVRDYTEFLTELSLRRRVGIVGLQGYEPLLPESWPYSEALLSRANELGIETALVTNGTYLADRVSDLVRLGVRGITVSVDSADPEIHDRSRGTSGAFVDTLRGLEAACGSDLKDRILVSSVLQRGKPQYLVTMPQFLNHLGLRQWIVSPLCKVRRIGDGGFVDNPESIVFQLARLNDMARKHGVQLVVDDEFDGLPASSGWEKGDAVLRRKLLKLEGMVRLSPNGSCSTGLEILRRADAGVPVWNPAAEPASTFVERTFKG